MGNKSFSYPSKSCSDSKQMLRDLLICQETSLVSYVERI